MKYLAILTVAAMSAGLATASNVDLTLHTTGDDPIFQLSGANSILNVWGTPDTPENFPNPGSPISDTKFEELGPGTAQIDGLNLIDNSEDITSLSLYAYGTFTNTATFGTCTGAGVFSMCTPPAGTFNGSTPVSVNNPIVWTFTGGTITKGTEFRIVDPTGITGANLFYEIEINGAGPSAVPEPSTMIPTGIGLLAIGLLVAFRRKQATTVSSAA
jgi:hypothetical protein